MATAMPASLFRPETSELADQIARVGTIARPVYPGCDDVVLKPTVTVDTEENDRLSRVSKITVTISDDRMTCDELEAAAARVNLWLIQRIGRHVKVSADVAEKSATLSLRVCS